MSRPRRTRPFAPGHVRGQPDSVSAPTTVRWEAYTQPGQCERCGAPAAWALVRLNMVQTLALSLIRLACAGCRG